MAAAFAPEDTPIDKALKPAVEAFAEGKKPELAAAIVLAVLAITTQQPWLLALQSLLGAKFRDLSTSPATRRLQDAVGRDATERARRHELAELRGALQPAFDDLLRDLEASLRANGAAARAAAGPMLTELRAMREDLAAHVEQSLRARDVRDILDGDVARCEWLAARRRLFSGSRPLHDGAPPSAWLTAAHELVPYVGRGALLDELTAWATSDRRFDVRLVHAAGGAGKTRLAIELSHRLGLAGAIAGFVDADGDVEPLFVGPATRVVVVDYAAARAERVVHLLRLGARLGADGPRVRLLLLARGPGEWWPRLGAEPDVPRELLHEGVVLALGTREADTFDRPALWEAARAAFEARIGRPASGPLEVPALEDATFDKPLAVLMHALVSRGAFAPKTESELLREVLRHEEAHLRAAATRLAQHDHEREEIVRAMRRALATVTLWGGGDEPRAREAIRRALADDGGRAAATLAASATTSLAGLYPRGDHVAPLEPDLLGETLVEAEARRARDDGVAWLERVVDATATEEERASVVTVLGRIALRTGDGVSLGAALGARLGALALAAVRAAADSPSPTRDRVGAALFAALRDAPDVEVAERIAAACPHETVALAEPAELATRVVCDSRQGAAGEEATAELAAWLGTHGRRLGALGRHEAALAATQEAVDRDRELAHARPDAFLPGLARSLSDLGLRLRSLRRSEEALAASNEALGIRRELARAQPDEFLSGFAASLDHMGLTLGDLGRHEEALTVTEEAVGYYRDLARARPEVFLADLAVALNNLGNRLSDLGRSEDAFAATDEAVAIRRALARDRPDAYQSALANALSNLGLRLYGLGRTEEALAASREAVEHYRDLARARPEAFLPELSRTLSNLGLRFRDLGRYDHSLAVAEEALRIRRELARARPQAFLPRLAASLDNVGLALSDVGRHEEALAVTDEAVSHYRELARSRPDAFLNDLGIALNNLGGRLSELGRHGDALAATEEAVRIRRDLARARPEASLPDYAQALSNLGRRLGALGRHDEALAAIEEAVRIRRELAVARPERFLGALAASLDDAGLALSDLGRREDALAATEASVEHYRELARSRPRPYLEDLAIALYNVGDRLIEVGRRDDALAAFSEAVSIRRELARSLPDVFLAPLARSVDRVASVLAELGRKEDAAAASEEARAIREQLAAAPERA